MKKIIAKLIAFIMILSTVPSAFATTGDVTSHYVQYNQFACVRDDDQAFSGLYNGTRFDVWSKGQDSADPLNPVRAAYWNFDVNDYVSPTQEIKTAVMLFSGIITDYSSSVKMYDCEENVVTGSGYLDVPEPDTSSAIGTFTLRGISSVAGTYTGVSEDYNIAVDITTYLKEKTKSGDNDFTYMMYPEWGWGVYGFTNVPVLYIETTEVVDRSNILSPAASVYTGSQIPDNTKPLSNGGGYLYATQPINPSEPGKALFYKFDLSKYTDNGTGIEKAEFMQVTNDPGYSRLFYIYDVPENDLQNGQKYADVSTPAANAKPIVQLSSPGNNTVIDKEAYPGVEYDYNFYADLTDYVQDKISTGNSSFTLMIYAGYGTTAGYDLLSPPALYITPGVTNPDTPTVKLLDQTDTYKDSEAFVIRVEATDSNGIGDIDVYLNGVKKEGTMTSDGDVHTFTAAALNSGEYEMQIVVSDIYGKATTITKNITVKQSKAIIAPIASVYTGSQIPTTSKPLTNGGGFLYARPSVDPSQPGKALFYKFDLSEFTEKGIGIDSVTYMQITNNPGYTRLFCLYDIPENDLENGQVYANVSLPKSGAKPFRQLSSPGANIINKNNYPGVEEDYNFYTNITEYVKQKISIGEDSFTIMVYPGYQTTAGYDLLSYPALYVKLGEINLDVPVVKLINEKTVYSDRTPLAIELEATDSNGIGSVDIYLNGVKKEGNMTQNGDIYTFTTGAPNTGEYEMKIVVSDKYGKSTTLTRNISVEYSRDVLEPVAWAYTCWGDETQTSQKYTPPGKSAGYWAWANTSSLMWKEPLRAIYCKYDVSEYISKGYTISKAYLSQATQTGGQAYAFILDCPENDLVMGDVYNTVPKANTSKVVGSFDIGTVTPTYRDPVAMQMTCPGVNSANTSVFDISSYVAGKLTDGETSFTIMEYPRYANGYVWFFDMPQLYIEFTRGSDVKVIDTSDSACSGKDVILSASVESEDDIKNVEFYINDALVAETKDNVGNIYAVNAGIMESGTYELKVVAETVEGGQTAAIIKEFTVGEGDMTESEVSVSSDRIFVKENVNYIYVSEDLTAEELGKELGAVVSGDVSEIGNVITVEDNNGAFIRNYVVVDSGYISNAVIDITYPEHNGVAKANMYSPIPADVQIIVAGYKDNRVVSVGMKSYDGVSGTVELSAETEYNEADSFKAFIFDSNLKPLKKAVDRRTQVALLRFDDFSIYSYEEFDKLMTYFDEEQVVGAFGVIGITLDPENEANANVSGYNWHYNRAIKVLEKARDDEDVEIWGHGYVHSREEFNDVLSGGFTYEQQKESLGKLIDLMNKHGISLRTFAPPNDSKTQTTVKVISENFPQIDTLMHFGYLEMAEGMICLENDVIVEPAVGDISFDLFKEGYMSNQDKDYIQLLAHPGLWDANDWSEYRKIVEFLKERGAIFMTPSQYHDSIK